MKQEDKTIEFKSNLENYPKEKNGLKPNTVRFTDDWTKERWAKYNKAIFIKIVNKEYPEHHFTRSITDKTKYKNIVIISWRKE